MKQTRGKNAKNAIYIWLSALCLATALFVVSLSMSFSHAKYVTENGGDTIDYQTQMPANVGSQEDFFNAVTSGYGYVKISDNLDGPIIMTGNSLTLKNDMTIDLNGNEIQRNSRDSLLDVPAGRTLTIIDSNDVKTGGLYNPIGSVLTVTGGNLNVYGGKFESGPRPTEYYNKITQAERDAITVNSVRLVNKDGSLGATADRPILPVRSSLSAAPDSGNLYFDTAYTTEGGFTIKRDTYCYVAVGEKPTSSFETFDVSQAAFAYTYRLKKTDSGYSYTTDTTADTYPVMVFGYEDDIALSMTAITAGTEQYRNYAAVSMQGGELNVNVVESGSGDRTASESGSFHSYFGTWHTYCVLMNGGVMNVATTGKFETVNPADLPALSSADTRYNSAKYGENGCILCAEGTLNVRRIDSLQTYNGSGISVSGGTVNIQNATITKTATLSHYDDPYQADDKTVTPSIFPERRQYRDAALFINGGTLNIKNSDVLVEKQENVGQTYPLEEGQTVHPKTTFGILSRGRKLTGGAGMSYLKGDGLNLTLQGSHSYGIYATRGTIELDGDRTANSEVADDKTKAERGKIILESDQECYGVYADNRGSGDNAARVQLNGYRIFLGEEQTYVATSPDGLTGNKRMASIGVYLDSSRYSGGNVALINTGIHSQEMGVAVNDGNLMFSNGGTIHAYNASAVALRGGTIYFDAAETIEDPAPINRYEIKCYLNRQAEPVSECKVWDKNADEAGTHRYDIYVPWQSSSAVYENTNAIRVMDGNFIASKEALLDVTFRGLFNDYKNSYPFITEKNSNGTYQLDNLVYVDADGNYSKTSGTGKTEDKIYFDNVVIKSFAIACTQEGSRNPSINIQRANIKTEIGGGIKVAGGTITLGDTDSTIADITVNTTGNHHYWKRSPAGKERNSDGYNAWHFYPNLGGGHAVVARNGTINIYSGKYTAKYGNGVAATGNNATVTIYDGEFHGNMEHNGGRVYDASATGCYNMQTNGKDPSNITNLTGPASHYGVKVMGAATINIKGGSFDGENGGMFVRGQGEDTGHAKVYVYEGRFGENPTTGGGQDGVVISEHSEAYFGAYTKAELIEKNYLTEANQDKGSTALQSLIFISGFTFPISANALDLVSSSTEILRDSDVDIRVYYGHYQARDTANMRGLGHIDDKMTWITFAIYGYGTNVINECAKQPGSAAPYNSTRIRCWGPTDTMDRLCSGTVAYYGS